MVLENCGQISEPQFVARHAGNPRNDPAYLQNQTSPETSSQQGENGVAFTKVTKMIVTLRMQHGIRTPPNT